MKLDDITEKSWTEDVLLETGVSIQVRRSVKIRITNSWSGDAYNAVEQEASLSFSGPLSELPKWTADRMALVIYRDQKADQWVIVATTTSSLVWQKNGKPNPPYWEYRLDRKNWVEVPLSPESMGKRANLFHHYDQKININHLTVEDKKRLESDPAEARMYKEILKDQSFSQ